MLMHECLAVLAALIMLALLAAVVVLLGRRLARDLPGSRGAVVGWARPPPRTSVRLAQLCVLRN